MTVPLNLVFLVSFLCIGVGALIGYYSGLSMGIDIVTVIRENQRLREQALADPK